MNLVARPKKRHLLRPQPAATRVQLLAAPFSTVTRGGLRPAGSVVVGRHQPLLAVADRLDA